MDIEIWVDADSLPVSLRDVVLRASIRLSCRTFFVADRNLPAVSSFIAEDTHNLRSASGLSKEDSKRIRSKINMVVVQTGQDSADNYIVSNANPLSLCITHDIPLASRLLEKGCFVINDRGYVYDLSNIRSMLGDRAVNEELRMWGVFENISSHSKTDTKHFSDCLDRMLTRIIKERCKG